MKTKSLALILFFSLLLSACSSAAATPQVKSYSEAESYTADAPVYSEEMAAGGGFTNNTVAAEPAADPDRMVIKNADLSIAVEDPLLSLDTIGKMADDMGGYVVTSNTYKTTSSSSGAELPEANITIRVPAAGLTSAIDQIKQLTPDPKTDVINESISGQDVTQEYTDLSSRLRNLEAAEQQLQEIMDEAKRTEDVMTVYNQLTQVREQIEVIKGQMKYYEQSAALSSVSVRLVAKAGLQPINVGGWEPTGVAREAVQALIKTLQFLGSAGIWVVIYVIPTLILLAIPLVIFILILRRLTHKKKA